MRAVRHLDALAVRHGESEKSLTELKRRKAAREKKQKRKEKFQSMCPVYDPTPRILPSTKGDVGNKIEKQVVQAGPSMS